MLKSFKNSDEDFICPSYYYQCNFSRNSPIRSFCCLINLINILILDYKGSLPPIRKGSHSLASWERPSMLHSQSCLSHLHTLTLYSLIKPNYKFFKQRDKVIIFISLETSSRISYVTLLLKGNHKKITIWSLLFIKFTSFFFGQYWNHFWVFSFDISHI